MKTKFTKLLLCGTAVICSLAGTSAFAADPVTLNVWSDAARLPMFTAFDAAHENVVLNVTTVSPPDLVAKIQLAMQAGTEVPDVAFLSDINYTSQLSKRGSNYVLDLTGLVSQELRDQFATNANAPCEIGGKLMCLRNDVAQFHIWYNAPLMDELGETVPKTWEEFAALGARIAPKGMSLGSGAEGYPIMNFMVSAGCDFASPVAGKPNTLRIDLTTEECLRPARMMDEMLSNGSLLNVGPFDPKFSELYQANKIPLLLGPSWFGEHIIKAAFNAPDGVTAAAIPPRWADLDKPVTWHWGGGTYAGWKNTKHVDEVVDLIEWMATSVDNQKTAATMPAHQPSSKIWGEAIAADPFYANDQTYNVMLEAVQYSDPNYVSLRINLDAVFSGTITKAASIGESVVDALPALETELVNQAKLNGYTVVK